MKPFGITEITHLKDDSSVWIPLSLQHLDYLYSTSRRKFIGVTIPAFELSAAKREA